MKVLKKVAALLAVCSLALGVAVVPAYAADTDSAIIKNPANASDQPHVNKDGISGYIRFEAKNENGNVDKGTLSQRSEPQHDSVVVNEVESMTLTGEVKNTSTTEKNVNITLQLPKAWGFKMGVDVSRFTDIQNFATSNVPNSKVKVSVDPSDGATNPASIKTVRINGVYMPGETITLNIPVTTPTLGEVDEAFLYVGADLVKLKIKGIEKVVDIADLVGAKIYPALAENNTGSGNYKVWDDLIRYMPPMSKDLIIASNKVEVWPDYSKQPDLSIQNDDALSDDALYTNSRFLILTQPIFEAIKDHGYSTYADTLEEPNQTLGGKNIGFWNAYGYKMQYDMQLVNQNGELFQVDKNGKKTPFYVEVHKVLDAEDLHLNVGDKWTNYDNLTYHKTVRKNTANSTDIPLDQIRVQNNVDTTKAGKYDVKYLYDVAPGKTVTISAKVIVNGAPELSVKDATIKEGEELDLKSLIVSATDAEDGDLTSEVTIEDEGGFDNNKAGEYTITYKVSDSQGASTTKTAKVTVLAKETQKDETVKPSDNSGSNTSSNATKKSAPTAKKQILPKTSDINNIAAIATIAAVGAGLVIAPRFKKQHNS